MREADLSHHVMSHFAFSKYSSHFYFFISYHWASVWSFKICMQEFACVVRRPSLQITHMLCLFFFFFFLEGYSQWADITPVRRALSVKQHRKMHLHWKESLLGKSKKTRQTCVQINTCRLTCRWVEGPKSRHGLCGVFVIFCPQRFLFADVHFDSGH